MDERDSIHHLETFFADSRLTELCELLKTSDDILDVITLIENQHSDILAWMLDPREGHGQGDQILRDLLLAATQAADQDSDLDGRGTTARFFSEWRPSRVMTSSFSGVFIARELGIKASERVDLFVIDPINKFVLLIENKAGAAHSSQQLDNYRKNWMEAVNKNAHLKEYSSVFIALDRKFTGDDGGDRPSNGYWLHLGYDWLKASADRALLHLERGNSAARLVVSYCNRQTDWESPVSKRAITLAAELHEAHPIATKQILGETTGRIERHWIKNEATNTMMFMLQNKAAISLLREMRGMASMKEVISSKIKILKRSSINNTRTRLYICPPDWEKYETNGWWPVYFSVICSDETGQKYDIALHLSKYSEVQDEDLKAIQDHLEAFNESFAKHKNNYNRKVVLNEGVTATELIQKLIEHSRKLQELIA